VIIETANVKGVDQLKVAVVAMAKVATLAGTVLEDGKVTFWELPQLAKALSPIETLLALVTQEALLELSDLSEEERVELSASFKAEFDLADDVLELAIEEAVELAFRWVDLATDTIKYGRRVTGSVAA